jgi:hypothetical protein
MELDENEIIIKSELSKLVHLHGEYAGVSGAAFSALVVSAIIKKHCSTALDKYHVHKRLASLQGELERTDYYIF